MWRWHPHGELLADVVEFVARFLKTGKPTARAGVFFFDVEAGGLVGQ